MDAMVGVLRASEWDFSGPALPKVDIHDANGNIWEVGYQRHHVIPVDVFEQNAFLQALQSNGLWNQADYAVNGVSLVSTINGQNATYSPLRDIIGTAAHTGGHTNYSGALRGIFDVINAEYQIGLETGNWGSHGSEAAWLSEQAKSVNGLVAFLKVELSNPNSALKLHTSDSQRIDLTSKDLWEAFREKFFDVDSLTWLDGVADHPAFIEGSKFEPGVHAGAGAFDATPGSGSALDITAHSAPSQVSAALRDQFGVDAYAPSVFDKAHIRSTVGIVQRSNSTIVTALAAAGLVTMIFRHQEAMAAESGQEVSFNEARSPARRR